MSATMTRSQMVSWLCIYPLRSIVDGQLVHEDDRQWSLPPDAVLRLSISKRRGASM
jgi:hypothetical protein